MKPLYSITAYAAREFPRFWDCYPTLTSARKAAAQALKDGYEMLEIYKDAPLPAGHAIGAARTLIETIKAAQ